jgi:hypothetical protein
MWTLRRLVDFGIIRSTLPVECGVRGFAACLLLSERNYIDNSRTLLMLNLLYQVATNSALQFCSFERFMALRMCVDYLSLTEVTRKHYLLFMTPWTS